MIFVLLLSANPDGFFGLLGPSSILFNVFSIKNGCSAYSTDSISCWKTGCFLQSSVNAYGETIFLFFWKSRLPALTNPWKLKALRFSLIPSKEYEDVLHVCSTLTYTVHIFLFLTKPANFSQTEPSAWWNINYCTKLIILPSQPKLKSTVV